MIQLVHENCKNVLRILRNGKEIPCTSENLVEAFWDLAGQYPEDLIVWIDNRFSGQINEKGIAEIFHHDLIMTSFPVTSQFLPDTIGYIDQLPFVNPKYDVKYPSWRMSTDVGGIRARTALRFQTLLWKISDFGYLINTMAKIGQQNSLFCYTNPALLTTKISQKPEIYKASKDEVFLFVYQHYKSIWVWVLFFCYIRYESKFPVLALLKSFFNAKYFKKEIDLSNIPVSSINHVEKSKTVDVIIPTMGRPGYLKQVLLDLKEQSHLPENVIIVEQNPRPDSETELEYIKSEEWPFKIVHHFTHKTGACMARNLAMTSVTSAWMFFADDDIRIDKLVIENALLEISQLELLTLNMNCVQPDQESTFNKIKQWGAFASGTSLVNSEYARKCKFETSLEYGYGEDTDFGLQLRARGADVIYHPTIKIIHLKAEHGGFRTLIKLPWEDEEVLPKPSPTMMVLIKKHYSREMIKGYKVGLFLKFYSRQKIKNPFAYINSMKARWKMSERWAEKLETLALNQDD